MKISVIVPVYKVEPYLRKCVDSVLGQTFKDFELILVDDGSPDNCGKICDEYAAADDRVKVIHQANGGLSAARNAGIDWVMSHSKSEYVTFIDSDDWVSPDYLSALCKGTACGADVSCVSCYYVFNDNAKCRRCDGSGWKIDAPEEYWVDSLTLGQMACAKLYRKELFADVRFPIGRLHEDVYTTHRLLFKRDRVAYSGLPLYFYRMRKGSIIHQESVKKSDDAVMGLNDQWMFFKKMGNRRLQSIVLCRKLALMISLLPRMDRANSALASEYRNVIAAQASEVDSGFWDGREYYRLVQCHYAFWFRWVFHVLKDMILKRGNSWLITCFPSVLRLSRMERREPIQYE